MTGKQFQELKIGDVVTPHMLISGKGVLFRVIDKDSVNGELTVELIENQYGPFTKNQVDCLMIWGNRIFRPYLRTGTKDGKIVGHDFRTSWLIWALCKGVNDKRSKK